MTIPEREQWAREIVVSALAAELGRDPYAAEVYAVQAVSRLETGYGLQWKGAGIGSNNWGAITAGAKWTGDTFEHRDSYPNSQGENVWYVTKFRKYAAHEDGARDVVRFLLRMGVIGSDGTATKLRTFDAVSRQLYVRGYYKGFGATDEERIAHHRTAVANGCAVIARALGESPGLGDRPMPERVIVAPSRGPELPGPPPVIDSDRTLKAAIDSAISIALKDKS
jgi:hypothetical protein